MTDARSRVGKNIFHVLFIVLVSLLMAVNVQGNSSSPNVENVGTIQAAAVAASSDKITFSEYSLGTYITNQYADYGIIFGGDDPYIENDGAQPETPVLSGSPQYQGAIEGYFVNPADGVTPATVSAFSLDAGWFDDLGSTRIEWFDLDGNKLGEQYSSIIGIEKFEIREVGIASWRIAMATPDSAGFTIDNVQIIGDINVLRLDKVDDVPDGDCRSPLSTITYTITWENPGTETVEDVNLIDFLPEGVGFDDFVEAVVYQPISASADPNIVFAIKDANALDEIILPVGQSIRLYLTKETFEEEVLSFYLEANISDPNLGWIDNTEYDPNNPGTAEILAQPRGSFFDYYGPGYTQEEGIQFFAANLGNAIQDGNLASFVYTATQPGYVVLTLVDYNAVPATLEEIIIRQTDPNDPNNVPDAPEGSDETPVLSVSSIEGVYDEQTHIVTWELGNIAAGGGGSVSFSVIVNQKAEPGMTLHNVAKLISGDVVFAIATEDTQVCCWDTTDPNIIFVDKNADGNNNGTSWTDSYTDLQDALERARNSTCQDVNTIYVAAETYSPGPNTTDSFEIPDGVSVYGGFAGNETSPDQRDIKAYPTILTGYIDSSNRNETVVIMGGNETLLDGVIVQGAELYGQGILCEDVDATIANCTVKDNLSYGIYADNSNVELNWSRIENNGWDGIRHFDGETSLTVENCRVTRNGQNGIYDANSIPTIRNSIICGNGSENTGFWGIWIANPKGIPLLQNNTVTYNYNEAISYFDSDANHVNCPDVQNCIIWYNNEGGNGEQFAGWKVHPQYSCVQDDPNDPYGVSEVIDGRNNFSHKPDFAYSYSNDPNVCINVHLATNPYSFCKDKGSPNLSYADQNDIDGEARVADEAVDVGADEINCYDVYNPLDWDADGIVGMPEFNKFSQNWLSHDPNDPAIIDPNYPMYGPYHDPSSPWYIRPSQLEQWHSEGYKYNLSTVGESLYSIDVADLMVFLDEAPWSWVACWRHDIQEMQQQSMMMGGSQQMMMTSVPSTSLESLQSTETSIPAMAESVEIIPTTEPIEPEEFNPAVERANILSLLEDIDALIAAGGDDAETWQKVKNILEQTLVDTEDTINDPNEI